MVIVAEAPDPSVRSSMPEIVAPEMFAPLPSDRISLTEPSPVSVPVRVSPPASKVTASVPEVALTLCPALVTVIVRALVLSSPKL